MRGIDFFVRKRMPDEHPTEHQKTFFLESGNRYFPSIPFRINTM